MPTTRKTSAKRRLDFEPTSTANKRRREESADACECAGSDPASSSPSLLRSPTKIKTHPKAVVTPDVKKFEKKYVPTYLHKNLAYLTEGKKNLPPTKLKALKKILTSYHIPDDLEQSRKYGPLSGMSFEEKVLQAYSLGHLEAIEQPVDICTQCGDDGHRRDECPTLL